MAHWPQRDFPALAAQVRVPVRFSLADHEPFWENGPAGSAVIAVMFTASPRVVVNEQRDSGHNLSLGFTAAAYHLGVLSFVEKCIVAREEHAQDREVNEVESEAELMRVGFHRIGQPGRADGPGAILFDCPV